MDPKKLQKIAVAALEDVKAKDIEVINTTKLTAMFDRIIVASADSTRQVNALARNVQDKVREAGGTVYSTEGEGSGEWVLVDLGDIVIHVMQPAVRAYYNLEELWSGKARPRGGQAEPVLQAGNESTPSRPSPSHGGGVDGPTPPKAKRRVGKRVVAAVGGDKK
jgi:ribosome-associated protein